MKLKKDTRDALGGFAVLVFGTCAFVYGILSDEYRWILLSLAGGLSCWAVWASVRQRTDWERMLQEREFLAWEAMADRHLLAFAYHVTVYKLFLRHGLKDWHSAGLRGQFSGFAERHLQQIEIPKRLWDSRTIRNRWRAKLIAVAEVIGAVALFGLWVGGLFGIILFADELGVRIGASVVLVGWIIHCIGREMAQLRLRKTRMEAAGKSKQG